MYTTIETRRAHAEGRAEQFLEMMQALSTLETKYSGVRGALLKKVREELEKLKPLAAEGRSTTATPADSRPTSGSASPRCDACGREMKMTGTDGRYVCMNGHFR